MENEKLDKQLHELLMGEEPDNLWGKFKEAVFGVKYAVRRFFLPVRIFQESVVRVFQWLPFIWKDRDWDYVFLFKVIQYKIKRMAELQVEYGSSLNRHETAAEMMQAIHLLELIEEAEEFPENFDYSKTSEEEAAVKKALEYIAEHYQGWWD